MDKNNMTHRMVNSGDHLVVLYRNEEEVVSTIVPYISESLLRGERCIYITGDANIELVTDRLAKVFDLEKALNDSQLVMLNNDEAYSKSGTFNPDKMIELLISETEKAIAEGFTGLSLTGEISWVLKYEDGFDRIIEYEWKLNEYLFDKYPISALCRYNMKKFSNEMIINIIQLHPFISMGNIVYENPFYLPSIGFLENDIAKYQVETWLKNIVDFTNTKSKFHEEMSSKEEQYDELLEEIKDKMILSLIGLLEVHDTYTKNHSESVATLALKLAKTYGLSKGLSDKAYFAGLVHDIGKILIPKAILLKEGKLSSEEYDYVKQHSTLGYEALLKSDELHDIALYVKYHHERYDGLGYPSKLKGEEIPIVSRILTVVDSYDAMMNNRPYRDKLTKNEAIAEIRKYAGIQFDPKIARIFIEKVLGEEL
jgi:MEDS: MEthanogen/methylotroph, DcmR Sensory domain/HD domain